MVFAAFHHDSLASARWVFLFSIVILSIQITQAEIEAVIFVLLAGHVDALEIWVGRHAANRRYGDVVVGKLIARLHKLGKSLLDKLLDDPILTEEVAAGENELLEFLDGISRESRIENGVLVTACTAIQAVVFIAAGLAGRTDAELVHLGAVDQDRPGLPEIEFIKIFPVHHRVRNPHPPKNLLHMIIVKIPLGLLSKSLLKDRADHHDALLGRLLQADKSLLSQAGEMVDDRPRI